MKPFEMEGRIWFRVVLEDHIGVSVVFSPAFNKLKDDIGERAYFKVSLFFKDGKGELITS